MRKQFNYLVRYDIPRMFINVIGNEIVSFKNRLPPPHRHMPAGRGFVTSGCKLLHCASVTHRLHTLCIDRTG